MYSMDMKTNDPKCDPATEGAEYTFKFRGDKVIYFSISKVTGC